MATTKPIKVSEQLYKYLQKQKKKIDYKLETYEQVIWRLIGK